MICKSDQSVSVTLKASAHRMFQRISIRRVGVLWNVHQLWPVSNPVFRFTWTALQIKVMRATPLLGFKKQIRKQNGLGRKTSSKGVNWKSWVWRFRLSFKGKSSLIMVSGVLTCDIIKKGIWVSRYLNPFSYFPSFIFCFLLLKICYFYSSEKWPVFFLNRT